MEVLGFRFRFPNLDPLTSQSIVSLIHSLPPAPDTMSASEGKEKADEPEHSTTAAHVQSVDPSSRRSPRDIYPPASRSASCDDNEFSPYARMPDGTDWAYPTYDSAPLPDMMTTGGWSKVVSSMQVASLA